MKKGVRKGFLFMIAAMLIAGLGFFSACGGGGGSSSGSHANHTVTVTNLNPASPGFLSLNQDITISFSYTTTEAGGVRIFIRPFTEGALTPSYAAEITPLYPTGSGTDTTAFHLTAGTNVHIDQLRIQVFNADQSVMLLETFVDVDFTVNTNSVTITNLNPASPGRPLLNQYVNINFSYNTLEAGGARVFFSPMTEGAPTPSCAASGSPVYASGGGTGTAKFLIFSGTGVHIDHLRIRMYNEDQSTVLFETLIPVDYTVNANSVTITNLDPAPPALLALSQNVTVTVNYNTLDAGGVLIFIRPFTEGVMTPHYSASGSLLFPTGAGTITAVFSIDAGFDVHIDQLRIQMFNGTQSTLLFEDFVDVDYTVN